MRAARKNSKKEQNKAKQIAFYANWIWTDIFK